MTTWKWTEQLTSTWNHNHVNSVIFNTPFFLNKLWFSDFSVSFSVVTLQGFYFETQNSSASKHSIAFLWLFIAQKLTKLIWRTYWICNRDLWNWCNWTILSLDLLKWVVQGLMGNAKTDNSFRFYSFCSQLSQSLFISCADEHKIVSILQIPVFLW